MCCVVMCRDQNVNAYLRYQMITQRESRRRTVIKYDLCDYLIIFKLVYSGFII